jgi:nickel transport protein
MKVLALIFSVLLSLGFTAPALAHTVETNYQIAEHKKLETHSLYSTGEPFSQAPVRVYAPNGSDLPWLSAQTDAQGQFTFTPDTQIAGRWLVEIGQSDHADNITLDVSRQGVQVKEINEKAQAEIAPVAHPFQQQWLVLGFATVFGSLGTRLFASYRQER